MPKLYLAANFVLNTDISYLGGQILGGEYLNSGHLQLVYDAGDRSPLEEIEVREYFSPIERGD